VRRCSRPHALVPASPRPSSPRATRAATRAIRRQDARAAKINVNVSVSVKKEASWYAGWCSILLPETKGTRTLVDLGRHYGLFKDRVEHSGKRGAPLIP
jgi:hypothetical protein